MTSREIKIGETSNQPPPLPLLESIRRQIAKIPQGGSPDEESVFQRGDLDHFSAARIFVTFKVKLAEHFPEPIPSESFDFLVDLMIHEWLSRRVGSERPAEFGVPRSATLTPRVQHALTLALVEIAPDPDYDDQCIISLTRSARARLNVFFDYMASYISVL